MGDRGGSNQAHYGLEMGAAQNNSYGNHNRKKIDSRGDDQDNDDRTSYTGKTNFMQLIEEKLLHDPIKLILISQKLRDIEFIVNVAHLSNLMEIDISRNYLDNINILNELKGLQVIIASNNYIRKANLQLPKLRELDIRNNFITSVPILSRLPSLQVLTLNANNIVQFKLQCSKENYAKMTKMVFRNNKIQFSKTELASFVKQMKEFKQLQFLNLENNPLMEDITVVKKIVKSFPKNLELFNNERKLFYLNQIEAEEYLAQLTDEDDEEIGNGQQVEAVVEMMPTLEHLLFNLEAANSRPSKALQFLQLLAIDADKIIRVQATHSYSIFVQSFTKAKDPRHIRENIETFMQHTQLLVDNNIESRTILLQMLSKLTQIRCHDFGIKCFYTLRDFLSGGQELEALVIEQLNQHVMKIISEANSQDIPIQILIGLKDLILGSQESNYNRLVSRLFDKFFPKWLIEIKQEFQRNRGKSEEGDSHHADEIFALLTASLRDNEKNVGKMYAQGLHNIVAEIFLSTSPQKIRYNHLLEAMNEIAKLHSHAASQIIEKNVHSEVITEIKLTFYRYKMDKELIPPGEDYSIADVVAMYRMFSAQIDLIASLINAEEEQRKALWCDDFVVNLLQVVTHTSCDPVLLNSICYLAIQLLECDEVKYNPDKLAKIIDNMQSCTNLLGYLGMDNFKELIRSYKKYNGLDPKGPVTQAECQMENLNDPILTKLFISIVKLIEYFQKSLEYFERWERNPGVDIGENNQRLKDLSDNVSASLNDFDREEGLFNVLDIPNDDVRLAVVNCLYYVPIDEIDSLEITLILNLLDLQSQNVGVGKTELVLAVIFNILSNLVRDTQKKNAEVTSLFKNKFSNRAISLGIEILQMNQERTVDDLEEETEKYTLALSILNFFKHASLEAKTKNQLNDKPQVLKQILYSEQQFTYTHVFQITPVEIEATQMGMNFDALTKTIAHSQAQIEPYNWVSFRILHQMANLLQNQYPKLTYMPYKCEDQDTSVLIEAARLQLKLKKAYEDKFWEMQGENAIEEPTEDENKDIKEHHKNFTKKLGVLNILQFLTAQRNSVENWLRINSDLAISHAGEQEKHPIFGRGLKYTMRKKFIKARITIEKAKLTDNLNTSKSYEETKKPRGKSVVKAAAAEPKEKPQEFNSKEEMQKILIEDEFGSGFITTDNDLYLAQQSCSAMTKQLKQRQRVRTGIDNNELRCLSIAAFLRCLYASIDSAPSGEYHEKAINNINSSDKIFLSISQLCASTGWIQANIGSKYLQVMRYITRLNPNERIEQEQNLYKYEILSIVIKRILGLLKGKIKNQNHNQELNLDDKNLLCHLSIICSQLVNQSALFHWRKKKDHYGKLEELEHYKLRFQITDTLISRLFGIDQVKILIDVVFQEIQNAAKRFNGSRKEHKFKLKKDLGNNTLESLKRFLTEYLAYCETNKYNVLQYLTYTMVNDASKKMRIPYLEEILEGTNQIQLSLVYMRKMIEKDNNNLEHWQDEDGDSDGRAKDSFYCRSLCYKKKLDMQLVLDQFQDKLTQQEEEQIERDQSVNDINCSLGENILFTKPMPVHVKYENKLNTDHYQVFTVMMTNLGVYIINDSVESCKTQNPADRHKVQCPQRLDRFHYSQIKRVYVAKQARQRIVLCIQREVDQTKTQDFEIYMKPSTSKKTASFNRAQDETTGGNTNVGLDLDIDLKTQAMAKRNKNRGQDKTEQIYVTLVTTSINDSMLINQFLDEAKIHVEQSDSEAEDVLNFYEDKLLEYSMVMYHMHDQVSAKNPFQPLKQTYCPQCRKPRIEDKNQPCMCKCGPDNYIVYAYQIKDFGERTSPNNERVQRGGPARLLNAKHQQQPHSKRDNSQTDQMDTEFGVLMVTSQGIYFFTETPGYWQDMVFDDKSQQLHTDKSLFELFKEEMLCKDMLNRNEDRPLFIDLRKLKGMSKMQQKRVPSLQFRYTDPNSKDVQQVVFSMMSDFSIEETLFRVKDLKSRSSSDADDQN